MVKVISISSCFAKPARGGQRHNLTSSILVQLRTFDEGGVIVALPYPSHSSDGRKKRFKSPSRENSVTAKRASVKLGDGDVRGAVRTFCSSESGVLPDHLSNSNSIMLSKHPSVPVDWRCPPRPTTAPLLVSVQDVLLALRSFSPGSASGVDGLRP